MRPEESRLPQAPEYLPRIAPGPETGRRLAMRLHSAVVPVFPLRPAPVEYAVAVQRYLAAAPLGAASRRIYQISLTSWAWPLVGRPLPQGAERRGATPPVVPLAWLDRADTGPRLAAAIADRAVVADARTRHVPGVAAPLPARTGSQVAELLAAGASLREQAFWRVLYDSAGHADDVLGLDSGQLDSRGHRARAAGGWIRWHADTGQLVRWLLAGRSFGPVFLTDRRAPAGAVPADICPVTGRARMSYRRAAEIFTGVTRQLDPAGRGWTLQQLSRAGLAAGAAPAVVPG